ncbi:MAG: abortive infection family protein [Candidatus Thiodiazotropha sp.]|nr:abortive infection family protein [Candidatus Thiodiazotropha sp.]
MPKLKRTEIKMIDTIFDMESGYCLNFSDRTMAEFFEDELGIVIYQDKYSFNGSSKAKHVRAFIEIEDNYVVVSFLRKLWNYKITECNHNNCDLTNQKLRLFELIGRLESCASNIAVGKLSDRAKALDLDTVTRDLDRALSHAKDDPESALTSACSTLESVCRSLLIEMEKDLPKTKDLMNLYKAVRKPLGLTPDKSRFPSEISNDILKILGGLTTVIEGVGALRTHGGDAHGREKGYTRIDTRIASLSVHAASSVALFLIETWQRKYPGKKLTIS